MTKIQELFEKCRESILYLFFGVLTTVVSLLIKFGTNLILFQNTMYPTAMENAVLCLISWIGGVTFAYITNRIWVFQSQNKVFSEAFIFYLSRASTLMFDTLFMQGMCWLKVNIVVGTFISTGIVIVLNYILSKTIVFTGNKK